jgi:hypothetical protein
MASSHLQRARAARALDVELGGLYLTHAVAFEAFLRVSSGLRHPCNIAKQWQTEARHRGSSTCPLGPLGAGERPTLQMLVGCRGLSLCSESPVTW